MLIKFFLIQKRDNYMMTMDNKESKTEDHQEAQALEDYLIFSLEEAEENKPVQEKENQN